MAEQKLTYKNILLPVICLLLCGLLHAQEMKGITYTKGAMVRGDSNAKTIMLVFTADEFGEGLPSITQTLKDEHVKGNFFFTGRFYRNPVFRKNILKLQEDGHYLGPHSDEHLLYCDWVKRDSLLVTRDSFSTDLENNIVAMESLPVAMHPTRFFIAPYEWWNDTIAAWTKAAGFRLFNFTPGMRFTADYTYPEMGKSYKSNEWLMDWFNNLLKSDESKLNGAILLIHAGTDPRRTEKLYHDLPAIIASLKNAGFTIQRVDELLP